MVLVQNWPFFHLFFGNPGQENVFYDILEQKKRLSRLQKQEVQKVEKLRFFQRGLVHGFGPIVAIFHLSFLGNLDQLNVFYDILERKIAFLGYNNKKIKKSKN